MKTLFCEKMSREKITDSVSALLNNSYFVSDDTVIGLLNDVLNNEANLANLLAENKVVHEKGKLPGLIVQVSDEKTGCSS